MATFAAPLYVPKFRAFDSDGEPLAGGKVYAFLAGTSTPTATYPTYDDALAGTNANTHPVLLDANGEANIFCLPIPVKIQVNDVDDVLQWTQDDVPVAMATPSPVVTEWVAETDAVDYGSGTSFLVGGDVTAIYTANRRTKTTNTGGTVYSTITSSSYNGLTDATTVNVINDSGTLDAGLSAVWYGLLSAVNPSLGSPRTCVSVIKNGDQTTISTAAQITAWTEQVDAQAEFVTPTFTAKYPGKYLVNLQLAFLDSNADAVVTGYIYVNGSAVSECVMRADDTGGQISTMSLHWAGTLAAGGTVEVYAAGTNATIKGTSGTRLSVTRAD